MLIGQAWLAAGAEVTRDAEHDAHAWWPPEPEAWPDEADPVLRRMASAAGHVITFTRLKYLSFFLSGVYLALLIMWLGHGPEDVKFVLGWIHGIGWIVIVAALHHRRAPARDPALARRAGGRRGGRRAVCRQHRLHRL